MKGQGVERKKDFGHMSRGAQQELTIRNRIATIFLTIADQNIYHEVLQVILESVESEFGLFGYIGEDGALFVPTLTKHIWNTCQVADKKLIFPKESWGKSTWAEALREQKMLYSNEQSQLTPEGHMSINRHVSQPILYKGEAIGLILVANKETEYEETDLHWLETIANAIAPILKARLQRDREERDRLLAELRLEKTVSELSRSNGELEQFAYVVSHDLQEPLRMIASYVQLLGRRYKGQLDDDADDFITYAVDGASRMQTLINDLLAYSRVGTRGREFEQCDCNVIVEQTLKNLEVAIAEKNAAVVCSPLATVTGDPVQLSQLFQNLIGNAIKFCRYRPPEVHVNAERQNGELVFCIKDNGIGILPEYFDRIFMIFQRLHGKTEYDGTGIGLAISKKIVERHNGHIWVESMPGNGSSFYFTLPEKR